MTTNIKNKELIISDSFGMWITGLWGNIFFQNPDFTFGEHKQAFLSIIKELFDDGRVSFVKPGADVYYNEKTNPNPKYTIQQPESHWGVSSDEIVDFLLAEWPEDASHRDDPQLNGYFYKVPAIIWKNNDGEWFGS
ncbi:MULTISPECIES: hypothetical protein [unclassified Rhizobium]|uniref:hypothetical protein n=1 Tax=unclassified Rhizobium TaxID=2613769 RepID=UPI001ADC953A|nr:MULTISPECIES: hypothetical protein [unclassified Rhizobium]MBO9097239.1 hypothetical protein [Rhizobium sp. L58/93]MBO9133910.1 hypothetical protein [Rhizobium sp. B209b/85]MBO9183436.1 hypothetical protein [Rhizobium sp. E27B/91]QXZ83771.1 hypothetical protein J5287_17345 [Rhizobium sp. K1/93]QXZ88717.1 hypothetical protein J5280_11245 [Rhizobium sp. K15/93]